MRPVMTYWNYVRKVICGKCRAELTRFDWNNCPWCGEEIDWDWKEIREEEKKQ